MTEIVKVQVPIFTTSPALPLVYDEGRRNVSFQPIDPATIRAMRGEPKAFFEAIWDGLNKQWTIGKRVHSNRNW